MPLVKAVCTNCNANLEVDSARDAAICPYCGTAYIVEKAINNYHIQNHMHMPNPADTMYEKAMTLVRFGEEEKAQQVLERMLDEFPGDARAPRYLALQWLNKRRRKWQNKFAMISVQADGISGSAKTHRLCSTIA